MQVARCLEVNISELLTDSVPGQAQRNGSVAAAAEPSAAEIIELVQSFGCIANPEARAKILEMARFFKALDTR